MTQNGCSAASYIHAQGKQKMRYAALRRVTHMCVTHALRARVHALRSVDASRFYNRLGISHEKFIVLYIENKGSYLRKQKSEQCIIFNNSRPKLRDDMYQRL